MNTQPLTDLQPRIENAITVTKIYLQRENTKIDHAYLEKMLSLLTDELNMLVPKKSLNSVKDI